MLAGNVPLFAFDPQPLVKALKDHRPDIVDIHQEPYSVAGFEATFLATKFAANAPRIFCTAQNIQKRYPPPFRWTEQFVYKHCVAAYMCSQEAEQVLKRKGYRGITELFPLGVDTRIYSPKILDDDERAKMRSELQLGDDFVVGFFGRLEDYKGPQLLVEALSQLRKAGRPLKLLIAGSGPFIETLQSSSRAAGVANHVHFAGSLAAAETPKFISLCDTVAVPSLTRKTWKEQFGRVPVEAMACGVPVISSDSGSLPEVVAGAGLIVAENDAQALAESISRLMDDLALRKQLIESGLARVKNDFSWEVIADLTYKLYQRILQPAACPTR